MNQLNKLPLLAAARLGLPKRCFATDNRKAKRYKVLGFLA